MGILITRKIRELTAQEIAQLVEGCLRRGKRIHQGKILGAANAGGACAVELTLPVPGVGRVVSAIAGNDCLGGACSAVQADSGTWYALSVRSQSTVLSRQVTTHRGRRAVTVIEENYPFKFLFSITGFSAATISFFIGGDRITHTKISELPFTGILTASARIANTNKNKTGWIVGTSVENSNPQFSIKSADNSQSFMSNNSEDYFPRSYGSGLWIKININFNNPAG